METSTSEPTKRRWVLDTSAARMLEGIPFFGGVLVLGIGWALFSLLVVFAYISWDFSGWRSTLRALSVLVIFTLVWFRVFYKREG